MKLSSHQNTGTSTRRFWSPGTCDIPRLALFWASISAGAMSCQCDPFLQATDADCNVLPNNESKDSGKLCHECAQGPRITEPVKCLEARFPFRNSLSVVLGADRFLSSGPGTPNFRVFRKPRRSCPFQLGKCHGWTNHLRAFPALAGPHNSATAVSPSSGILRSISPLLLSTVPAG